MFGAVSLLSCCHALRAQPTEGILELEQLELSIARRKRIEVADKLIQLSGGSEQMLRRRAWTIERDRRSFRPVELRSLLRQ